MTNPPAEEIPPPPFLEFDDRRRGRAPVIGVSLAALSAALVVLISVTSCFGSGFAWTPATPTPTATATPTVTPTDTPTPTATATVTATASPTATSPFAVPLPPISAGERWVLVDLSDQTVRAMVGGEVWHTAYVTTGKDGWETPVGEFTIGYRVYDETMTSASIGAEEYYVLEHVMYTQYFTNEGHALHLNYWRPDSVFGNERTSHGCVGMRWADAEFFWDFAGYGTRVVIQP